MANILKLYTQGRAKSPTQLWEPEEMDALVALANTYHISFVAAADWIRNGAVKIIKHETDILVRNKPSKKVVIEYDFSAYEAAIKKGTKPETLDDAIAKAQADMLVNMDDMVEKPKAKAEKAETPKAEKKAKKK